MEPDVDEASFIMPAYNEEEIIEEEVTAFLRYLRKLQLNFELLIVENGSKDHTLSKLRGMEDTHDSLRVFVNSVPDFGRALRRGIRNSSFEVNFIVHVDHWDPDFIEEALKYLDEYSLVQGSKNLPSSRDRRSFFRKSLTYIYNILLKLFFNFKGTDTTGLKAFRKTDIRPILDQSELNREMLETELVLRCQYSGIPIKELPVTLKEKRPQRDPLVQKIWCNCVDLIRLLTIIYAESVLE